MIKKIDKQIRGSGFPNSKVTFSAFCDVCGLINGIINKVNEIIDTIESDQLTIKIKYHNGTEELVKIEVGDWIDLRAAEDVTLKAGELKYISLGVSMELPDNYEAHVLPRSSTPKNYGVMCANSMGVIDNSYSGDNDVWMFPALAFRNTEIKKNDRICQFRIVKRQPKLSFKTVLSLGNKDRGGIGSTGR